MGDVDLKSSEYEKIGVLLVHGITGNPTEMKVLERRLKREGFHTSLPVLAGHGKGHKEMIASKWEDWMRSIEEAYSELRKSCDQVYVIGLCASASAVGVFAARKQDVAGAVLLSSHYGKIHPKASKRRFLLDLIYPFPFLRRICYWTESAPYGIKDPRMQEVISAALKSSKRRESAEHGTFRTYAETFYQTHLVHLELRKVAKNIKCPVLGIHSLEDSWFGPDNSVELFQDIGSLEKQLVLINNCDHVITVDLEKERVAELVSSFLMKCVKNRSTNVKKVVNG